MKKLLCVGVALFLGACSGAGPTAPAARQLSPDNASFDAITCRSGYIIAYRSDGTPYCVPADQSQTQAQTMAAGTAPEP